MGFDQKLGKFYGRASTSYPSICEGKKLEHSLASKMKGLITPTPSLNIGIIGFPFLSDILERLLDI